MANRTDIIVQKVLRNLKDESYHNITRDIVLNEMSAVQTELCIHYMALKSLNTIVLLNGVSSYAMPTNVYKIKDIIEPSTWKSRITVLNDLSTYIRYSRETILSPLQPLYAYFWNKQMMVTPSPVEADTLTIFTYNAPSVDLADGVDPEIGVEYDDCLEWETTCRFNGDDKLHVRYVERARLNGALNSKEAIAGVDSIDSSYERLGF